MKVTGLESELASWKVNSHFGKWIGHFESESAIWKGNSLLKMKWHIGKCVGPFKNRIGAFDSELAVFESELAFLTLNKPYESELAHSKVTSGF